MQTDLCSDLGIAGDDGQDVLDELGKEFRIDWSELHFDVHFGNEVCALPMPWKLKHSHWSYETQPCLVSDLVHAAETGKWPGTPLVRRTGTSKKMLYLGSCLQIGLLCFILAITVVGVVTIYTK